MVFLPERGVFGSELFGDPFEVDVCDGVEAPSLESIDEALRVTSSAKSSPIEKCELYFLGLIGLLSLSAELVPKMSLDPPPGGLSTLDETKFNMLVNTIRNCLSVWKRTFSCRIQLDPARHVCTRKKPACLIQFGRHCSA